MRRSKALKVIIGTFAVVLMVVVSCDLFVSPLKKHAISVWLGFGPLYENVQRPSDQKKIFYIGEGDTLKEVVEAFDMVYAPLSIVVNNKSGLALDKILLKPTPTAARYDEVYTAEEALRMIRGAMGGDTVDLRLDRTHDQYETYR